MTVNADTVKAGQHQQAVDAHYVADPQTLTIHYVDAMGHEVGVSHQVSGVTDQTVNVLYQVPKHYVLLSDMMSQFKLSADSDENQLMVVVAPKVDFRFHVTNAADLNKTVMRTINITMPNGKIKAVVQSVKFVRDDAYNEVTGTHDYTNWIADGPVNFESYIPDVEFGYMAPVIKSVLVTPDTENQLVNVAYTKLNMMSQALFIDTAGHTYNELPAGYHVVAGQTASRGSQLIVKNTVPITPQVIYVTRTVTIKMPNGKMRIIKQKVRKGTEFGRVAVPKLRSYRMQVTGDSQELSAVVADNDMDMTVSFIKI